MLVATRDPAPEPTTDAFQPSPLLKSDRRFTVTSTLQVLGSLLAIPLTAISGYSAYRANFSVETTCETLRANIISMIDKKLDPDVRRMLVRRDVETFQKACTGFDPDAEMAFRTMIAGEQKAAATKAAAPPPAVAAAKPEAKPELKPSVSAKAEAPKAEPAKLEAAKAETKSEPKAEIRFDTSKVEVVKPAPAKAEPAKAEPVKTEAAKAEPAKVEAKAEAKAEPKPEVESQKSDRLPVAAAKDETQHTEKSPTDDRWLEDVRRVLSEKAPEQPRPAQQQASAPAVTPAPGPAPLSAQIPHQPVAQPAPAPQTANANVVQPNVAPPLTASVIPASAPVQQVARRDRPVPPGEIPAGEPLQLDANAAEKPAEAKPASESRFGWAAGIPILGTVLNQ